MGGRQGYTGYVNANTGDCPRLSANALAKMGALQQRCTFTLTFPCGSELGGSYDGQNCLALDPDTGSQDIHVEFQPMHFGGHRFYLHCSRCYNRRVHLYWGDSGLYCRKCYRLVYRSQQCGDLEWALSKQRKIERKLDGKMRKTKRAVLETEFYELDNIAVWHLVTGLQRITGKL